MDLTEITFGREKYHLYQEMIQWCQDNIGPGAFGIPVKDHDSIWGVDMTFGYSHFYFKSEQDAMMFSLKWVS